MRTAKGVYQNGSVTLAESLSLEGPVDVIVVFGEGTEAIAQQSEIEADVLLGQLDAIANSIEGEFDSAADIREVRKKRADNL